MQRVTMVRYTTKPGRAEENAALCRSVFSELENAGPDAVSYAVFRNGDEFLHLFLNFREDDSDAVTDLPSFKAFSVNISERCEQPPQVTRLGLELLARYGFTRTPALA